MKDYSKIHTRFFDDVNSDIWTGMFPEVIKRGDNIMIGHEKRRVVWVNSDGDVRKIRLAKFWA